MTDEQRDNFLKLAQAAARISGIRYGDVTVKLRDGVPYLLEFRQTIKLDD